jgi:thiol-disulfide isomerase/thioredoxin
MRRTLLLGLCLVLGLLGTARGADDAQAMLDKITDLKPPKFDQTRQKDEAYIKQFVAEQQKIMEEKADLEKQFYDKYPEHPQAAKLLSERWSILPRLERGDEVATEADAIIAAKPDSDLAQTARYAKVQALINRQNPDPEKALALIDDALKAKPGDPRAADLMVSIASHAMEDPAKRTPIFERVVKEFPNSKAAKSAEAQLRQVAAVGKPFELSFTDAISGKTIDVQKDLKGKVVVVDFWATWCGPCVAEMPKNKELYKQFKDKGVEFIGISLDQPEDQGGLSKLKEFVKTNDIQWPQYYQGNGWASEFSSGWGINSIPRVFIVDANGKLVSTEARGKLEQMIPELLAKRGDKTAMNK